MDIDGLLEIIKKRRHNGRVKADPIPDESLKKIIEAASWAPSGNNAQPWEFVVIKNPETKVLRGNGAPGQIRQDQAKGCEEVHRERR